MITLSVFTNTSTYVKPNLIPLLTLENYELPLIKKYVHAKFILKRIKSDSKFFD